jgi:class 3 adenylate cyclase/tetratricopeptide (TPR) repeat protein
VAICGTCRSYYDALRGGCERCAAGRERRCQWCDYVVEANGVFCSRCGHKLLPAGFDATDGLVRVLKPNAGFTAPGTELAVGGERKQVTVLFADIVESTAMIRDLDSEQSSEVLDPVVRGMAKAVKAHGGLVAGLMGDGLKGIFGAPMAQADHADRACVAALEIRELGNAGKPQIRIGLNSGEVVMRALETGADGDYDAMGMPVHIAARLEQLAQPGKICLSATTAHLVRGRFQIRRLGLVTPKGIVQSIEMFELVRRRHARSRWESWEPTRLTQFVGRTEQLRLMQERLDLAAGGSGQLIAVTGEAGAGKSRLLYELLRRNGSQGWTVMTASADADDSRSGFRPFAMMLRTWLGIGPDDAPARVRAELREHLLELGGMGPQERTALAALLDIRSEEDLPPPGGPELRQRIMNATVELVRQCARRHPTLLVFEDIHWLDKDSQDLLRMLEASTPNLPMVLIVTYRPPSPILLGDHAGMTMISLPRLSEDDARHILDIKLGRHASLAAIKENVIARSQGIPLFLEEIARSLIEDGTLVLRAGRYQAMRAGKPYVVPDSIRGILAERIDRLPRQSKEIVQFACVVGREMPLRLLCHVMGCRDVDLDAGLKVLSDSGLLQRLGSGLEQRLVFNHVLTQEVAYAGLLQQRRKQIHGDILAAFEALYPDRLDEHVETLAQHAAQAQLWAKASAYLRRAARKSIERSGHAQAVRFLREALEALTFSSGDVREKEHAELELRLLLRVAFNAIGNYRERLKNLDRAELLAKSTGRRSLLPSLMVSRASVVLQVESVPDALAICAKARRDATRRGDNETRVIAGYMLSRSQFYNGQFRRSVAAAQQALALVRAEPAKSRHGGGFGSSEVMLLTQMAQSQACLGEFSIGAANGEAAFRIAEQLGRDFDIGLASYGIGMVHLYAGDLGPSVAVLERGLRAVETGQPAQSIFAILGGLLSYAYLQAGAQDAALALCRRVLAYDEESYHHANWGRLYGAMILRETGQEGEALVLARRASHVARRWGYVVQTVWSDFLLAQLHKPHDPQRARRHLKKAMQLSEMIDMRPCLVRCLIQSGELYRQESQERRAAEALARATKLAHSIHMLV